MGIVLYAYPAINWLRNLSWRSPFRLHNQRGRSPLSQDVMRDMNLRIRILGLIVAAMLSLCVINVTAASTSTPTMVTHNGYPIDATSQQQTHLKIILLDQTSNLTNMTKVNQSVDLFGVLSSLSGDPNAPNYIGGATVHIQLMQSGKWTTVFNTTTETSKDTLGLFGISITENHTGVFSYRVTYDGNSQYAPTVSNVVKLTVN
jgi:hypothetical protein